MTLVQSFSGICQGPVRLGGNYFVSQVIFGTSQALKLISYTPTKLDSVTLQGYFWIFLQNPCFLFCFLLVCFCCCFLSTPFIYLQRGISSFCHLTRVKLNFCHPHKVRFWYPLRMILLLIIIFLTSTPIIFIFFCKAVLSFLKGSISPSFWYLLQSLK